MPDEYGVPAPLNLPPQSKTNVDKVRFVYKRFVRMKSTRSKNNDLMWDTYDRLFRNEPSAPPPEKWMANVFVPLVMSTILAIISETTDQRVRWKILPVTENDQHAAEVIQAITDHTLDKGNYDDEAFKRDLDKLIYGTSIWKEYYREDRRVIREKTVDKSGKVKLTSKDIREFQDVYGKHIPIRNFYLDDKAMDIKEARDCVERIVMDIDDFKTKYSKYKNARGVREWGFIKPDSEQTVQNVPPGGNVTNNSFYLPISDIHDNEVEVLEYWNKPNDEHLVIANGVMVVNEPIPYDHKQLPYAIDICVPLPNSAYGVGVPQMLESIQEELNTMHNMALDESKVSIHRPILMGGTTLLDEDEYQLRPKGIIPVDDVSQARELETAGLSQSYFQMVEEIKSNGRIASGLDVRFAEANSPQGNDTATEVVRLQAASVRRIKLYQKILMIRSLKRIAMLRTANIQQFYRDPLRVQAMLDHDGSVVMDETTGKPMLQPVYRSVRFHDQGKEDYSFMKEITPEDIRGEVAPEVVPQSTEPQDDGVIVKRLNSLLQLSVSFPPMLQMIDVVEVLKAYVRRLDLPTSIVKPILQEQENSDYNLANDENQAMSTGQQVPATQNPSMKHTMVHQAYIYQLDPQGMPTNQVNDHFAALPDKSKRAILKHYEDELQQHAMKGNVSPNNSARTVNRSQGTGTQATAGGEVPQSQEGAQ